MRKNEKRFIATKSFAILGVLSLVLVLVSTLGCQSASEGGEKMSNPFSTKEKKLTKLQQQIERLQEEADRATRNGKPHDARKAYEKILAIHKENAENKDFKPQVEPYCQLGAIVESFGQYQMAEDYYRQAMAIDERNPAPYNSLGYCYLTQKRLDEAIVYFEKAIEFAPLEEKYNNNLGLAYGMKKDYDRAFQCFRRVSTEADAYYNMSALFALNGQDKEAKMVLERAVELNPDHKNAKRMLAAYSEYEQNPHEFTDPLMSGSYPGSSVPYQESRTASQVGSSANDVLRGRPSGDAATEAMKTYMAPAP